MRSGVASNMSQGVAERKAATVSSSRPSRSTVRISPLSTSRTCAGRVKCEGTHARGHALMGPDGARWGHLLAHEEICKGV